MPIMNQRIIAMTKLESVHHDAVAGQPRCSSAEVPLAPLFPVNVCRVFVQSGARDLDAILRAAQRQDKEGLLACLHSLKGALLVLNERKVAEHCLELEKRIDSQDIDALAPQLEKLESQMSHLLQHYAAACGIHG